MLSESKIKEWKDQYGSIYKIILGSNEYVYKKLNIGECQKLQSFYSTNQPAEAESLAIDLAVIYPNKSELSILPAGEIKQIANSIISSAGVFHADTLTQILNDSFDEAQKIINSDFFQWKSIIMQTFPGYTFEALDDLDIKSFFILVRICENIREENYIAPVEALDDNPESPFNQNVSHPTSLISNNELKILAEEQPADKLHNSYYKT